MKILNLIEILKKGSLKKRYTSEFSSEFSSEFNSDLALNLALIQILISDKIKFTKLNSVYNSKNGTNKKDKKIVFLSSYE